MRLGRGEDVAKLIAILAARTHPTPPWPTLNPSPKRKRAGVFEKIHLVYGPRPQVQFAVMSDAPPFILTLDQLLHLLKIRVGDRNAARLCSILETETTFHRIADSCAFRDAVVESAKLLQRPIVLLDKGVKLDVPPPFHDHFEPINLGSRDPQAQMISGVSPKPRIILAWLSATLSIIPLIVVISLIVARGWRPRFSREFIAMFGSFLLMICIHAVWLVLFGARWFVIPRGMAIHETLWWGRHRLHVLNPSEVVACIRMDTRSDSPRLVLELWRGSFKTWSTGISESDALAFLAAWQGTHPTPKESVVLEFLRA